MVSFHKFKSDKKPDVDKQRKIFSLFSILKKKKLLNAFSWQQPISSHRDHLPTPPPIPEAIQRALEFLRSQPESGDSAGQGSAFNPTFRRPQNY
ncbi:hypothetical protein Phum_PHUM605860 [Pediculus humanus corporis]|uniref:Uncharacterized protein n=1 Tax=Pediculus humanus subsp. corporis TaxID=121224 RepID=E0W3K6_PEDHC|nr:uncharacterized protein Phum_PHUM605860 [Pediculus humanus corporis]EEB20212.1 hypothetical protein Phum_PHUM605860 [Pediculus humanus corporis]